MLIFLIINIKIFPCSCQNSFMSKTPAIMTRGLKEEHMPIIVDFMDQVISEIDNEDILVKVRKQVNEMMSEFPMFV